MSTRQWERQNRRKSLANFPTFPVDPVRVGHSICFEPWITFPYDKKLIPVIGAALAEQGWTLSHEKGEADCTNDWSTPCQTWTKKLEGTYESASVIVEFSDKVDGAVCKRKEIGKATQEVTVYDFACPEA